MAGAFVPSVVRVMAAEHAARSVEDILARHPDWCKTATVPSPAGGGAFVRLIYVRAASSVVCYDPATRETFFLPLDAELVRDAAWVVAGDPVAQGRGAETLMTPRPPSR